MSKVSSMGKIILVLFVLVVLVNGIAFFFLPENISLQINTNWDIHGSTVPKILFVFLGPVVAAGAYLYAKHSPQNEKQALALGIIAFVGSIATIIFNMIAQ
ncbi:hypothetical protein [Dethiobacter alkaliphilus]|uniref:DUF1648 domain-containing protein n=1 Tax=Dethiobacter alkaliphilus AHT 1 TaxID=555088 RepID=C0GFQ6_DETAL|nr:hypothetical protein [Dethiobacter alkaliphilus]EEG78016.1 conserved hypothetical protein [Dethiobacter alkaliphilus AHT 1]